MKKDYFPFGKFILIILVLNTSFKLFPQQTFIVDSIVIIGNNFIKKKQYENAHILYKQAIVNAKSKKDIKAIAILHKEIGRLYKKEKKYRASIIESKKSVQIDSLSLISAYCYQSIALNKRRLKETDSVLYYLEKGLAIYETQNDNDESYNAFFNAGIIFKNYQLYENALKYLILANEGFNKTQNLKKLANVNNSIAQIQRLLGNSEKAFYYYYSALSYRQQIKDTIGIAMSFNNIANAYKEKKEYDSALVYYNKSLRLTKKNSKREASTLYNIGVSHYLKKNIKKAKEFYDRSLDINVKLNNTQYIFYNSNELALLAIESNDIEGAKKYLDISNSLIPKIENQEAVYRNYEMNALFNAKKGDHEKAYKFQKKYSDKYQTVFNIKQAEIVQNLQEQYETEKKQNENLKLTLLNKENEVIIDDQENKIKTNRLLLILTLLLFLLILIAYLLLRQRQKALKHKQSIEQLKAVYEGQKIIKNIISKDLHDIVATNLDGIRLKIEALSLSIDKNKRTVAKQITDNIQDINDQMRLISHRLSPLDDKIKKYKLSEIIISHLSEFQSYRKILVKMKNEIPEIIDELKLEAQTNFYGILLEALNNIEKHSKATEVIISHSIDKSQNLQFNVSDNGTGLKEKDQNGVGILNIQQRTKLLQGVCSIFQTDNGTELNLEFPLNIHLK